MRGIGVWVYITIVGVFVGMGTARMVLAIIIAGMVILSLAAMTIITVVARVAEGLLVFIGRGIEGILSGTVAVTAADSGGVRRKRRHRTRG